MNQNHHDYILYSLSFASAIEKELLAIEDIQKQLNNRLEIQKTPIKDKTNNIKTDDPYPWLDKDDPQKKLSDRQILEK